jgi:hypothetical protein
VPNTAPFSFSAGGEGTRNPAARTNRIVDCQKKPHRPTHIPENELK